MPSGLPPLPVTCALCQSKEVLPGLAVHLCRPCLDRTVRFSFPWYLHVSIIAFLLVAIAGAWHSSPVLAAEFANERGEKAQAHGDYAGAKAIYEGVLQRYPKYSDALGNLAVVSNRLGDTKTRDDCLARLKVVDKNTYQDTVEKLKAHP